MNQSWFLLAAVVLLAHHPRVFGQTGLTFFLKHTSDLRAATQSHNDAVDNLITTAVAEHSPSKGPCRIDPTNKSITVRNLRFHCTSKQLQRIFFNLSPGSFPSGSLRGYTIIGNDKLHDGLIGLVWHGKNFNYPNNGEARGVVTNSVLHSFEVLRASIFPSIAPMDGKEAFEIDYKEDIASFLMVDYLRTVQPNLYLGYFAMRPFDKTPIGYFMLERV